jgi:1-phosphatidylinositol-4-phosphate 5-kinase
MYDITGKLLQDSLNPTKNKAAAFAAGESQGKSGSFFFFTYDKRFLIKTINKSEYTTFMKFLPEYYRHCFTNVKSLIARVYGIYKIEISNVSSVYFYLMENVLRMDKDRKLLGIFDLKGSLVNRDVDETGKEATSTLKDENYLRRKKEVILNIKPSSWNSQKKIKRI